LSALDRVKAARLADDIAAREIVDALAPRAGRAFIRLAGHGGSGKTTLLALLATRLAAHEGGRVLVLTFHHASRGDIEHVLSTLPETRPLLGDRLRVETLTGFLLAVIEALTGIVPTDENDKLDYARLDAAYRDATAALGEGPDGERATSLRQRDAERFDWDHILIDEAQDCTDEERDLLRAVYGHRRIAIADGMEQLVRRQTPCDWLRGLPRAEIAQRVLGDSVRMPRNIAQFVNAFERAAGFADWVINPREDVAAGRIVIAVGQEPQTADLVRAMALAAKRDRADPIDCLICVPHSNIVRDDAGLRRAAFSNCVEEAGGVSWDASDFRTRMIAPAAPEEWRIVQYDACRGLEGWITTALDLDQFYAQKLRYPSVHRDGRADDAGTVARRSLLIPLTRAVHMLVITVRDRTSPVGTLLREASNAMPAGVVEWCSAAECANRV
jgi:energy-coupling factor transporter ATP-binding protein EcfA2